MRTPDALPVLPLKIQTRRSEMITFDVFGKLYKRIFSSRWPQSLARQRQRNRGLSRVITNNTNGNGGKEDEGGYARTASLDSDVIERQLRAINQLEMWRAARRGAAISLGIHPPAPRVAKGLLTPQEEEHIFVCARCQETIRSIRLYRLKRWLRRTVAAQRSRT